MTQPLNLPAAAMLDLCRAVERAMARFLRQRLADVPAGSAQLFEQYGIRHPLHWLLIMAANRAARGHRH